MFYLILIKFKLIKALLDLNKIRLLIIIFFALTAYNSLAQMVNSDLQLNPLSLSPTGYEYFKDEEEQQSMNLINPFYEEVYQLNQIETAIEENYRKRFGKKLKLQGYEIFANRFFQNNRYGFGAHDNYILGPGDSLNIILQGGKQSIKRSKVTRDGNLIFDFFPPIAVSGKTLGEVRFEIENAVKATLIETEVYVTLNKIRNISINIVGEVVSPGMISISGLSTVVDGLMRVGGIKKTGSLRNIQIIHDNKTENLDLYPIIFSSAPSSYKNLYLQDGMSIVVPPIKKTASIIAK